MFTFNRGITSGLTIAAAVGANSLPDLDTTHFSPECKNRITVSHLPPAPLQDFQFSNKPANELIKLSDVLEGNVVLTEQSQLYVTIPAVREFQILLVNRFDSDLGWDGADGIFGPLTAAAVTAFQESRGIKSSEPAVIDSQTVKAMLESWPPASQVSPEEAKIIDILSGAIEISQCEGSEIPQLGIVKRVQEFLYAYGFDIGESAGSGRFCPATAEAISSYQTSRELKVSDPVTIDAPTMKALLENKPETDFDAPSDLAEILTKEWFFELSLETQQSMTEFILHCGRSSREPFTEILRITEFGKLAPEDKEKVIAISLVAFQEGIESMRPLLERRLNDGTHVSLDVNSKGISTLESLYNIATSPLRPEFEGIKAGIITDVIEKLADPFFSRQGNKGTCAPTALQYNMLRHNPGKAAYLLCSLLQTGSVELPNGQILTIPEDGYRGDLSTRPLPQQIFQAALMELGNGPEYTYLNTRDIHINLTTQLKLPTGLFVKQVEDLIEALYNRPAATFVPDKSVSDDELINVLQEIPSGSMLILEWRERPAGDWSELHSSHAVNFKRYNDESKAVHFWNPQNRGYRNGTVFTNPPGTMINRETGEESMPLHDLKKRLIKVLIINSEWQPPVDHPNIQN